MKKINITYKQKQIIKLICDQKTTREIADELFISVRTVESHKTRIMIDIEANNIVGIALWAVKNGLYIP